MIRWNCLVCEQIYDETPQDGCDEAQDGVCPACRRHARIGRAVEALPKRSSIQRVRSGDFVAINTEGLRGKSIAVTPLDALRSAGLAGEE